MRTDIETSLREIGDQLDSFLFPLVKNGGIVVPSRPAIFLDRLGKEHEHAKAGQRRSEAGSRERQPVWQRPPAGTQSSAGARSSNGSGTPGHATSLVSADLRKKYSGELDAIEKAYPGMQHWQHNDGMWLLVESSLLPGLAPKANFAVGIPFGGHVVRSWGFWGSSAIGFEWIGPRHTNFPDGSICAFEPTDQTWVIGAPLVELLDLYTLWALRHLHLRAFGRWPGHQAVPHPYERILELRKDEYCGCANSHKFYGQCCRKSDLARNQIAEAINFTCLTAGGLRKPPNVVVRFMLEREEPPQFSDFTA
jgi:hypothetical protein